MPSYLKCITSLDRKSVASISNSHDQESPFMVSETPHPDALRAENDELLCESNDGGSSFSPIMMGTLNDTKDENESMLVLQLEDVTEAINQMYNLASQIRSPKLRTIRTDIDIYKKIDGEIKSEYIKMRKRAELQGIEQIVLQSRKLLTESRDEEADLVLMHEDKCPIQRLQKANHARRQQFECWRRSKQQSIQAASKAIETVPSSQHHDERLTRVQSTTYPLRCNSLRFHDHCCLQFLRFPKTIS